MPTPQTKLRDGEMPMSLGGSSDLTGPRIDTVKPRGTNEVLAPLVQRMIADARALVNDMGQCNPNMRVITLPTMRRWQGEVERHLARLEHLQTLLQE